MGQPMNPLHTLAACGLIAAASVTAASAADRRVDIVNNTGQAITEFYASNTGTND